MTTLFTVNYSGDYGYLYEFMAQATEETYSIVDNTSRVTVYTYLRRNKLSSNSAYNGYGTAWTITIDGQQFSGTETWDTRNTTDWLIIGAATKVVQHNADGSKTITIAASHVGNSATGSSRMGDASGSATFTLTKIPRASSITATDANIESATTININRADNSFTHTITYSFSGLTGTIETKTNNTSVGWTVPSTFYTKIPNSKTGTTTLTCTTYSGDTVVGTSTTTFTITAAESKSKPTVTATLIDSNSTTVALTGSNTKLIKYRSTAKITPTATPKNSATIKQIVVNTTAVSGSYIEFKNTQTETFKIVATDSRGYINDEYILKPTIVQYIPLTLSAEFYRVSATSSEVKVKYNGNFFNASFGAVTNSLTVTWAYKLKNATSYTTGGTLTPTKSGNVYSGEVSLGTKFDYQQAYDFIIYASDKLTNLNVPQQIQKGEPIYDYGVDGTGQNYLNVNGGLYVKNQAILDLVYPVGAIYMSVNSINPGTLFGGTWVAWGTGRVPVGIDTSQTEFATVEKTGGSKYIQNHRHYQSLGDGGTITGEASYDWTVTGTKRWYEGYDLAGQVSDRETGDSGNLQPYITCYMWKRTK